MTTREGVSVEDRLEAHSIPEPTTGCYLWVGGTDSSGYGVSSVGGRSVSAHRLSYSTRVGPIPGGLVVRHICDTPTCINPDHLQLGTQTDNNRDRVRRGRDFHASQTHCKWGHPFSPENTQYSGPRRRRCRTCHNRLARESYERTKKT